MPMVKLTAGELYGVFASACISLHYVADMGWVSSAVYATLMVIGWSAGALLAIGLRVALTRKGR